MCNCSIILYFHKVSYFSVGVSSKWYFVTVTMGSTIYKIQTTSHCIDFKHQEPALLLMCLTQSEERTVILSCFLSSCLSGPSSSPNHLLSSSPPLSPLCPPNCPSSSPPLLNSPPHLSSPNHLSSPPRLSSPNHLSSPLSSSLLSSLHAPQSSLYVFISQKAVLESN